MMEGYQPVNVITPTGQYVDASAPFQEMGARQSYTNSSIAAYGANTEANFGTYDRQWDRYLYGSFHGASGEELRDGAGLRREQLGAHCLELPWALQPARWLEGLALFPAQLLEESEER